MPKSMHGSTTLEILDDDDTSPNSDGQTKDNSHELLNDEHVAKQLKRIAAAVEKGFTDQNERAVSTKEYWEVYNCILNGHQVYAGNSTLYLPIVHNAVNARKTRFVNQIFPRNARHVEVYSIDGTQPHGILATVEHYIQQCKLRTEVMPSLCTAGDVEGQYTLYVGWHKECRQIRKRVNATIHPETGEVLAPGTEAIATETVVTGRPFVEVVSDTDLCVLPANSDSIGEALEAGGCVAILRRYSREKIEAMIEGGELDEEEGETLLKAMEEHADKTTIANQDKAKVESLGIKLHGKVAEVFEVWCLLDTGDEGEDEDEGYITRRKIHQVFIRPNKQVIGCRRNPYWNDRVPVLSVPVNKVNGAFKGDSLVKFCADAQYLANDAVNEGMDSAAYALMPIIMTDPEKNPRVGSMVLTLAAVWETSPRDTQFAQFPALWMQAFDIVNAARMEINQTLSVSPAAITQGSGQRKKPTQAEIANEQQIDILTTADAVTVLEHGILTPLVEWFAELDYQFRDRAMSVRTLGPAGVQAVTSMVEPLQFETRYELHWLGAEAARNAQMLQQQIAGMNILRSIPANMYPGYRLNLAPAIAAMVEGTFGVRLAGKIFESAVEQTSLDPQLENEMITNGFEVKPSPFDDDRAHLQAHIPLMQMGDVNGMLKVHLQAHQSQMADKARAQAIAAGGGQQPGQPQPGGSGEQAGQPRAGAQPGRSPVGGQMPPGAIHRDSMAGAGAPPAPRRGGAS